MFKNNGASPHGHCVREDHPPIIHRRHLQKILLFSQKSAKPSLAYSDRHAMTCISIPYSHSPEPWVHRLSGPPTRTVIIPLSRQTV